VGGFLKPPGKKPRAGLKGDGFRPAEGRKVGVEGGYLPPRPSPPGSLEKPPQFHFTPGEKEKSPTISFHSGAPANRFPTRGPLSPRGERKQ